MKTDVQIGATSRRAIELDGIHGTFRIKDCAFAIHYFPTYATPSSDEKEEHYRDLLEELKPMRERVSAKELTDLNALLQRDLSDERIATELVPYLLDSAGYRVLTAESGRAATGLAESAPFDGVMIDVHMPGMNGFDCCIALQSKAAVLGRTLRVWFMTGAFTSDIQRRCAELGALDVFRKPFDFPSFLAQLEAGFAEPRQLDPCRCPRSHVWRLMQRHTVPHDEARPERRRQITPRSLRGRWRPAGSDAASRAGARRPRC